MGLCCPKVLISTKIAGSDSKYSSQVFLKIKRETDLSPLEIFYGPQVTFSLSKTKGCNGNFQASLAQFEGQTGVFCPSESALPALHLLHHRCPDPEPGDEAEGREWGWCLPLLGFLTPKASPPPPPAPPAQHHFPWERHSAAGKTGNLKTLGSKQDGECRHKHLHSRPGEKGGKFHPNSPNGT